MSSVFTQVDVSIIIILVLVIVFSQPQACFIIAVCSAGFPGFFIIIARTVLVLRVAGILFAVQVGQGRQGLCIGRILVYCLNQRFVGIASAEFILLGLFVSLLRFFGRLGTLLLSFQTAKGN